MLRGLTELLHLLLFYISFHVIAFMVLIGFLVYTMRGHDTSPSPQVYHAPVKVQKLVEVCPRIDGCPIVEGICEDCVEEGKWVVKHLH